MLGAAGSRFCVRFRAGHGPRDTTHVRHSDRGASAVEYGLLIALIAAVITVSVIAFGQVTKGTINAPCDALDSAAASSTCS